MSIDVIDFKCWQGRWLPLLFYIRRYMPMDSPFSHLVGEDSVRSILQPFSPLYCPFVRPATVPKGLWTSRSTSALWACCAASHFHPTNVPGVITPADKRLLGYLSLRDNEASEPRAYCYLVALSVRFSFKLEDYPPCTDFILFGSLRETQV